MESSKSRRYAIGFLSEYKLFKENIFIRKMGGDMLLQHFIAHFLNKDFL